LSKQYKDKLLFGEVRKAEDKLAKQFKITEYPKILVITDPHNHEGEIYQGDLKIDLITKFLNNYSYKAATYEKKLEVLELTEERYKNHNLCRKSTSNICILLFTDSS
jgi:hypothetical protein